MNAAVLHDLADHFELAFTEVTVMTKRELVPPPIRNGTTPVKLKPITSIEELLKHDVPYLDYVTAQVLLFDCSLWQRFVALFKRRS